MIKKLTVRSFSDLEETVTDQETRLTAAEENIQGINPLTENEIPKIGI